MPTELIYLSTLYHFLSCKRTFMHTYIYANVNTALHEVNAQTYQRITTHTVYCLATAAAQGWRRLLQAVRPRVEEGGGRFRASIPRLTPRALATHGPCRARPSPASGELEEAKSPPAFHGRGQWGKHIYTYTYSVHISSIPRGTPRSRAGRTTYIYIPTTYVHI